jgi:O-acetyl-ADP-ribose deacetylase (regulator of RNase III)
MTDPGPIPGPKSGGATLQIGDRRLEIMTGDITLQEVDAIANAANESLRGGGGVDGAIHRAAGPEMLAELVRDHPRGTPTGSAVATGAYQLKARWVLHAVGPVWRGGEQGEAELLGGAYRSCLDLCDERRAASVAFPAISMGAYGYPASPGARVAVRTVAEHLRGDTALRLARFVLSSSALPAFLEAAREFEEAQA